MNHKQTALTTTEVFSIKSYEALRGITKTREILATIIKYWLLVTWSLWDLRKIIKFNSCGSNDLFELEMSRIVLGIFMAAMHRRILKELTQVKKRTNTRKRPKETKLQGNHLYDLWKFRIILLKTLLWSVICKVASCFWKLWKF